MTTRRQATLYVPSPQSLPIESLRSRFNPVQFGLIRAHITLCREDEVADWDELALRITDLGPIALALHFGAPVRDRNLVTLPAIGSTESFDALRHVLLSTDGSVPRKQNPHITLIHPRNGICSDAVFEEITNTYAPFSTTFRLVTLIEQLDGGRWHDLASFS